MTFLEFPNIYSLLLTIAVCPISSVSVERFFSTVNRGMIPTRKSMTVERLNNLCVLSVEHDLTLRYSWKKSKVSVSQIVEVREQLY